MGANIVSSYDIPKYNRNFFRYKIKKNNMATTISERIRALINEVAGGKNTVFAEKLGVSEANIRSYLKGVLPKADILGKIVITCDISAMWLLTGKGEMKEKNNPKTNASSGDPLTDRLLHIIEQKDELIRQQAEETGQLRAHIEQLKDKLQKTADNANTAVTANVV